MNGSKEGSCILGVSCGDAAPAFEMQEGIFDEMAQLIKLLIIFPLKLAVFLWRNDGLHTLVFGLLQDSVAVVAFVREQVIGINSFNQAVSLCAIRSGTLRNNNSERHTMRIHGQMYLGVEPPFVRLMS